MIVSKLFLSLKNQDSGEQTACCASELFSGEACSQFNRFRVAWHRRCHANRRTFACALPSGCFIDNRGRGGCQMGLARSRHRSVDGSVALSAVVDSE